MQTGLDFFVSLEKTVCFFLLQNRLKYLLLASAIGQNVHQHQPKYVRSTVPNSLANNSFIYVNYEKQTGRKNCGIHFQHFQQVSSRHS